MCSRFFSNTVFGRAQQRAEPAAPAAAAAPTTDSASARANDRLPISVVASAPDNYNGSPSFQDQNITSANKVVDEKMSVQGEEQQHLSSHEENRSSNEKGIGSSFFKPLAWVVSCLALPRFPSRRRRLLRRRRQFGPPTRCSLRLKGLPAENFGDLPKTKRKIVQRRRANITLNEATVSSQHFEEEEEEEVAIDEPTESYLESLLCAILDFFGYFEDDVEVVDDEEFDQEGEEVEYQHEVEENLSVKLFRSVFKLFTNIFAVTFAVLTFPLRLRLPSLPPRKRTRRDKHFRAGTRSSLRLKGLPAESSGIATQKRSYTSRRQRAVVESAFSDDEEFDDDVVVDYEEPEPVLQRCLNLVLDRFGYFQDDDDVEEDEEPVGEEAEGAVNIRQPSGLLNRVCLAFLLPFKFVFNLISYPLILFPWRKSCSGTFAQAAGDGSDGEQQDQLGATAARHDDRKLNFTASELTSAVFWPFVSLFNLIKITLACLRSMFSLPSRSLQLRRTADGKYFRVQEQDRPAEEVMEEVGSVKVAFFSVLNKFGYFVNLNHEGGNVTVVGAMISPLLLTFFMVKSIASTLPSCLTLPPRDFQWKKNKKGKFFKVGSRQSKRLRGIEAEYSDLTTTARRRRSRRGQGEAGPDLQDFEVDEEEEVIGIFRSIVIRVLNSFGYFHELNADNDDDHPHPETKSFGSKLAELVTRPASSFITSVTAFKTKYLSRTTEIQIEESIQISNSFPGPSRQQQLASTMDEAATGNSQGQAVVSNWRTMHFFGSAKPIGQFDSDSEDEHAGEHPVQKANANLGRIVALPFLTIWNFVQEAVRRFRSLFTTSKNVKSGDDVGTEHDAVRTNSRISRRNNLHIESDVSEDEEEVADQSSNSFFHRVSALFSGSGSQVKNAALQPAAGSRMKSYVEIPSDSLVEGEMEHEATGNGRFTHTQFRQKEGGGSTERRKLLCCILPLILLLLPLLIFSAACQIKPEVEVCQSFEELSSQAFNGAYSGYAFFDKTFSIHDFIFVPLQNGASLISSTAEQSFTVLSWFLHSAAETSENAFFFCQDSAFTFIDSVSTNAFGLKSSISGLFRSEEDVETAQNKDEEAQRTVGDILYGFVHELLFGGFQLLCNMFASILQLLTWTWSCLWSGFVNVMFGIYSVGQWFRFASPVADTNSASVVQLSSDQIVHSILESAQLRDYISQKNAEHLKAEQQHLDEAYRNLVDKFGNEELYSTVLTKENELNILRQNIFEKIQVLSVNQADLVARLKEQESRNLETPEVDRLNRKFEQLKDDIARSRREALEREKSDERGRDIKSKLSELQAKIEHLESELAVLRLEAKRCCKNETFIRELVTSHLQRWINEDFGRWNDSMLLMKKDLEETLRKVGDNLLNDILSTASVKLKTIAESEAEKTVEFILTDVVNKMAAKNFTTSRNDRDTTATSIAREEIEKMVRNALTTYDADKTGLFDFALETAGGSVVSTRCTETYVRTGASYTLFGIPIWWPSNNPRTAIQVKLFCS